jgi:hypothetical protein
VVQEVSKAFTLTLTQTIANSQDENQALPSSSGEEEISKTSNHLQVFGTPEMVNQDTTLSPKVSLIQFELSFSFVQTLTPVVDSPTAIYLY